MEKLSEKYLEVAILAQYCTAVQAMTTTTIEGEFIHLENIYLN